MGRFHRLVGFRRLAIFRSGFGGWGTSNLEMGLNPHPGMDGIQGACLTRNCPTRTFLSQIFITRGVGGRGIGGVKNWIFLAFKTLKNKI
jgi:hypothetical protein